MTFLAAVGGGAASAQEVHQELAALRARVDSLERQNHALQLSLQRLPPTHPGEFPDHAPVVATFTDRRF